MTYLAKLQEGLSPKVLETAKWLRQAYIQQLFDNLIGNGDRHQGNILVSADERSFLIDHSRCFWLNFPRGLPFSGEGVMRELPRALIEKVRAMDEAAVRQAVGKCLTGQEIRAVLARKGLILAAVEKLIAQHGEAAVLY